MWLRARRRLGGHKSFGENRAAWCVLLAYLSNQLITLVDDPLEVSRVTTGKLELRKCRVALADFVESAVEAG
jgi:hypothetical protein